MGIEHLFKDPRPVVIESLHPSVILSFLQEIRKYEEGTLFLANGVHSRPLLALKRLIITILYEENISLDEWGSHFTPGESAEDFIHFCRTELGIEPQEEEYYITRPGILEKREWSLLFDHLRPIFERKQILVILGWERLDPLTRFFINTFADEFPLPMVFFSNKQPDFEYQTYMPGATVPGISSQSSFLYDIFGPVLPAAVFDVSSQASAGLKFGPFLLFLEGGDDEKGEERLRFLRLAEKESKGYFDWVDRYQLGKPFMGPEKEILYLEKMKKQLSGTLNINATIFVTETMAKLLPEGLPRLRFYLDEIFPLYDAVQAREKGKECIRTVIEDSFPEREKTYLRYYRALFSAKTGKTTGTSELTELCSLAGEKKWVREYYDILSLLSYLSYMSSDYEKAEKYSKTLLQTNLLPRNPDRDIEALNMLGFIRMNRSEWDKAYTYLKKANDLAVEKSLPLSEVMMNANIGLFFIYTEEYKRAVNFLEKALYGALRADIKMIVGNVYGNLGIVYANRDQVKQSLACYEKALRIFKEIEYRRGIYIAQDYMALNYYRMKDEKSALLYYAALEKMFQEWGEKRLLARSQANFARVYLHLKGNGERAVFYLLQSIREERDMGVQDWQWDIPILIDAWLQQGNIKNARKAFRELESLYKQKKLPKKLWRQMDIRKKEIDGWECRSDARGNLLHSLEG
ncbi:MAG TPA: hypothetical protein ENL15_02785, partial [Firmicutes bacterium]|nr:hypothetical protein [Bacillota bacterium]